MKRSGHSVVIILAVLILAVSAVAAEQHTLLLEIKGMHCSGCASGIEAMLKRVDGVISAEVSYEEREARVDYEPAKTNPGKIIEAVETLGYKATIKE